MIRKAYQKQKINVLCIKWKLKTILHWVAQTLVANLWEYPTGSDCWLSSQFSPICSSCPFDIITGRILFIISLQLPWFFTSSHLFQMQAKQKLPFFPRWTWSLHNVLMEVNCYFICLVESTLLVVEGREDMTLGKMICWIVERGLLICFRRVDRDANCTQVPFFHSQLQKQAISLAFGCYVSTTRTILHQSQDFVDYLYHTCRCLRRF